MKQTLSVLAVAATFLAGCGGDDDAEISDATPQGRLTIALSEEYETIFDVDRACVEEKTAVLTDEQAERAIEQITAEAVDPDLQEWLSSTVECTNAP